MDEVLHQLIQVEVEKILRDRGRAKARPLSLFLTSTLEPYEDHISTGDVRSWAENWQATKSW